MSSLLYAFSDEDGGEPIVGINIGGGVFQRIVEVEDLADGIKELVALLVIQDDGDSYLNEALRGALSAQDEGDRQTLVVLKSLIEEKLAQADEAITKSVQWRMEWEAEQLARKTDPVSAIVEHVSRVIRRNARGHCGRDLSVTERLAIVDKMRAEIEAESDQAAQSERERAI